jgi:hypothetical protein
MGIKDDAEDRRAKRLEQDRRTAEQTRRSRDQAARDEQGRAQEREAERRAYFERLEQLRSDFMAWIKAGALPPCDYRTTWRRGWVIGELTVEGPHRIVLDADFGGTVTTYQLVITTGGKLIHPGRRDASGFDIADIRERVTELASRSDVPWTGREF